MGTMSDYFHSIEPSSIRRSQMVFGKRKDGALAVNVAIGNVSLPMYPAMQKRMALLATDSPFATGINRYTETVGIDEANQAFLHIIASSGFSADGLYSQITEGASHAMDLMILGTCGPAGTTERPILLLDPSYISYKYKAVQLGRHIVTNSRHLHDSGFFSLPDPKVLESLIKKTRPGVLCIAPYDNPTGSFFNKEMMVYLAQLCVKYDMWFASDEAYRELFYLDRGLVSIWGVTNQDVPGIEGRRISIESASKVWNACGLRVGALVTDNELFHDKSVAANTPNLCSNAIGQYMFGALAHESFDVLKQWYQQQRVYYKKMMVDLTQETRAQIQGIIISNPDCALYSVIDVRNLVPNTFNSLDFALYLAETGSTDFEGLPHTLLMAPMSDFYTVSKKEKNPGDTQLRIAYVQPPSEMTKVPVLFKRLLENYLKR